MMNLERQEKLYSKIEESNRVSNSVALAITLLIAAILGGLSGLWASRSMPSPKANPKTPVSEGCPPTKAHTPNLRHVPGPTVRHPPGSVQSHE